MIVESAKKLIDKYSDVLKQSGINVSEIKQQQYCFEAVVQEKKDSLKLLVYFGKKGTKTVFQGNEESHFYRKIKNLLLGENLFSKQDMITSNIKEPEEYIGTDESGKGDYFGPLIIGGVYVNPQTKNELAKLGVKDSKEINDKTIIKIAAQIKNIAGIKSNIVIINPERYNQLYSEIKNVNKLLAWGHSRVLENLLSAVNVSEAISDKFGDERLIKDRLMTKGKDILLHQVTKAERFIAVAAASILARAKFVNWFEERKRELKIELPKGASSKVETSAKEIKKLYGEEVLNKLAKIHFKTTRKIIS